MLHLKIAGSVSKSSVMQSQSCKVSHSVKQNIPPLTNPLVAMAEVERPVMVVTTVAMATITQERAAEETTS